MSKKTERPEQQQDANEQPVSKEQQQEANEQPANEEQQDANEQPESGEPSGASTGIVLTDGPGTEFMNVIILTDLSDKSSAERASLAEKTVCKNLVGAHGEIIVMDRKNLKSELPGIASERIILMDDRMFILNPVTPAEIATVKAIRVSENEGEHLERFTGMPIVVYKSVLLNLLEQGIECSMLTVEDIAEVYFNHAYPVSSISPIIVVRDGKNTSRWSEEPWLLPVVSDKPNVKSLEKYAATQRFLFIRRTPAPQTVVEWLSRKFE